MQGAIRQTTRKPSKVCIKNVPFAALLARLHLGLAVSDRRLKVNCSAVMVVFSECLQRDSKFWLKCLKSKIKCNSEDYKLHQEDCFGLEEGVQQQGSSGVGRVHLHLAETPDALIVTKTQTESGQDAEKCLFLHFGGNSLDKSIEYFFPPFFPLVFAQHRRCRFLPAVLLSFLGAEGRGQRTQRENTSPSGQTAHPQRTAPSAP